MAQQGMQGMKVAVAGMMIVSETAAYTQYLTNEEFKSILAVRGAKLQSEVSRSNSGSRYHIPSSSPIICEP